MSCFILPDNHINVIVSYFVSQGVYEGLWLELDGRYQYLSRESAPRLAQMLYEQNVKSVNYNYNENTSTEFKGYQFIHQARDIYTVGEIAQALNSYDYQSCETDNYRSSNVSMIIHQMRKELLRSIIDDDVDTWTIETIGDNGVVYI